MSLLSAWVVPQSGLQGQYGPLFGGPNQAELPSKLPGQTRLPTWFSRRAELLVGSLLKGAAAG